MYDFCILLSDGMNSNEEGGDHNERGKKGPIHEESFVQLLYKVSDLYNKSVSLSKEWEKRELFHNEVRAEVEETDGNRAFAEDMAGGNPDADYGHTGLPGSELTGEKTGNSRKLRIDIEDNGRGISDEYIKALETDDEETLKGHLGLNNVNTIIRMYYGKEYGVKASRREEGGTLITVRVPLEYGEINE